MKHSTSLAHEVNISHDDDDYVVRENENESRKSSKVISVEWVANAAESNLCCSFVSFFLWSHESDNDGGEKNDTINVSMRKLIHHFYARFVFL